MEVVFVSVSVLLVSDVEEVDSGDAGAESVEVVSKD